MRRLTLAPRTLVVLGVVVCCATVARGDDMARAQVLELNKVTGSDLHRLKLAELRHNKDLAKKMIQAGLELIKEKAPLQYNTAMTMAQVAADQKDLQASEKFFRVCADQGVKYLSTRKLFEAYRGMILVYYNNKKYDHAVRICREALELKTDDGKERDILLAVKTRFGDVEFRELDTFSPARPMQGIVQHMLIQSLTKQGKFDPALKMVDNLLKQKDRFLNYEERELKGWVLNEAGRFEEAAKAYEDVIERVEKDKALEDQDKEDYLNQFRYSLSHIYVEQKLIDKAAEVMQSLIKKRPDNPGLYNDLGFILADHDTKLEEAEKLIRKALDLDRKRRKAMIKDNPEIEDRDNGAYLDSLGWVLFKQKRLKEAKEWLLKAIEDKSTQHIEIFDHLGDVHLALGDRAAALAAWRKGLEVVGEGRREMERKALVEKKIAKYSK